MEKTKSGLRPLVLPALVMLILIVSLNASCVLASENGKPTVTTDQKTVEVGAGKSFSVIGVRTLAEMLKQKDFLLVNVHIPYEGEIEKTDMFIRYDGIDENTDKLPDKNAKIVLYCRTDRMSLIAGRKLAELGYTNVIVLEDGMVEWKRQGFEILNSR